MDVRLVVKKGASPGRALRLKSEETIVGRRKDCDLRIRSAEVSRRHCLLSFQDGVLHVEDLDSVNGTFLNKQRVSGRLIARPGDELEIGPIRFVVQYKLSREASSRLAQEEAADEGAIQELDALPLAEDEAGAGPFDFAAEEELDALPLAEEDTELAQPSPGTKKPVEALPADDDDEPIPVADDVLEGKDWNMPQSNELRDILTQMDEPKGKRRPKEEK